MTAEDHGLTPAEEALHLLPDDPTDPNTADYVDFVEDYPAPLERAVESRDFPAYALPKVLGEFVYALSESTQTDTGLAGGAVLAALSAAVGGYVRVQVAEDYTEPTHVWVLGVAPPGDRKSSIIRASFDPLYQFERDLHARLAPTIAEQAVQRDIAERAAEKARRDAGNAIDPEKRNKLTAEASTLATQLTGMSVPAPPRLIGDDVTLEALVSHLADQGGRFALVSAEGGLFTTLSGRYGHATDITPVLKAHAGDRVRVDRKGRESEFIDDPALTLGLMIQPGILATSTANREFANSGLLARFLYVWPQSKVGKRNVNPAPVSGGLTERYGDALYSLASKAREASGTRTLTLSPEARSVQLEYAQEVEHELGPGGSLAHMDGWASKVVGAAVRIAGLIHAANEPTKDSISSDTMEAAILLARYFATHASKVFDGLSTGSNERSIARQILGVIRRHQLDDFNMRDLLSVAARSWLPNKDAAQPALDLLVEFGWLLPVTPRRAPGPGRPPAIRYRTHPTVWNPEPATRNPQNPQKGNNADLADIADLPPTLDADGFRTDLPQQGDRPCCPIHPGEVLGAVTGKCRACDTENATQAVDTAA